MTGRCERALVTVLLALVFVLGAETAFAQCAMCRRAFASPEGQQLVTAFRAGILLLLAAPFVSFATVAFLAVRRQRRRDAARRDAAGCRAPVAPALTMKGQATWSS
jgi:hypothetical protein